MSDLPRRVGPAVEDVLEVEVDGRITLYRREGEVALVLNDTASDVWRLCDGEHDVDEIVRLLAAAYAADAEGIRPQVEDAVRRFHDERLLTS